MVFKSSPRRRLVVQVRKNVRRPGRQEIDGYGVFSHRLGRFGVRGGRRRAIWRWGRAGRGGKGAHGNRLWETEQSCAREEIACQHLPPRVHLTGGDSERVREIERER